MSTIAKHPPTLPWYRSKIIVGTLVALASLLAQKLGLAALAPADQRDIVDIVLTLTGAAGGGTALVSRLAQKHAPKITGGK